MILSSIRNKFDLAKQLRSSINIRLIRVLDIVQSFFKFMAYNHIIKTFFITLSFHAIDIMSGIIHD